MDVSCIGCIGNCKSIGILRSWAKQTMPKLQKAWAEAWRKGTESTKKRAWTEIKRVCVQTIAKGCDPVVLGLYINIYIYVKCLMCIYIYTLYCYPFTPCLRSNQKLDHIAQPHAAAFWFATIKIVQVAWTGPSRASGITCVLRMLQLLFNTPVGRLWSGVFWGYPPIYPDNNMIISNVDLIYYPILSTLIIIQYW